MGVKGVTYNMGEQLWLVTDGDIVSFYPTKDMAMEAATAAYAEHGNPLALGKVLQTWGNGSKLGEQGEQKQEQEDEDQEQEDEQEQENSKHNHKPHVEILPNKALHLHGKVVVTQIKSSGTPKRPTREETQQRVSLVRKANDVLREQILAFMKRNRPYTSKEIVVGLGRVPGNKQGGPVVKMLKVLENEGIVSYENPDNYRGYVWVKN